jgi:hypothetical protein
MNNKDIEAIFTYHNPAGIDVNRFTLIREAAKHLGIMILENGGTIRDVNIAISKLRECIHFAIASIVVPDEGQ